MSISTVHMSGERLIVATLAGFSDEALRAELARRESLARQASGSTSSAASSIPSGLLTGGFYGTHREEIHEVIALGDFDSLAMVDELCGRPNFYRTLLDVTGAFLFDRESARALVEAAERGDVGALRSILAPAIEAGVASEPSA